MLKQAGHTSTVASNTPIPAQILALNQSVFSNCRMKKPSGLSKVYRCITLWEAQWDSTYRLQACRSRKSIPTVVLPTARQLKSHIDHQSLSLDRIVFISGQICSSGIINNSTTGKDFKLGWHSSIPTNLKFHHCMLIGLVWLLYHLIIPFSLSIVSLNDIKINQTCQSEEGAQ